MWARWLNLVACWAARRLCQSTLSHRQRLFAEAAAYPHQSTHYVISHKGTTKSAKQITRSTKRIFVRFVFVVRQLFFVLFVICFVPFCGLTLVLLRHA